MHPTEQFKGIETFVYTADAGSFAAAAIRLNLTSSAVSKSVARLESRLGVRLFERTTRRLRLTDAGQIYYRTCTAVLEELKAAETILAAQTIAPSGRLRVDLPSSYGRSQVMPVLLAFAQLHTKVRLHVSFTDRFVDLIEEGIDVGVRIGGPDTWPASVAHRYLGSERLIFCAAPSYIKRRGMPKTEADLAAHDSILYRKEDGTSIPWRINHGNGHIEYRTIDGRIALSSGEAQVGAVCAGAGIAQLSTWLIKDELANAKLVEILPQLVIEGLPLSLVWPRSRQLLPKISALVDQLTVSLSIS